MEERLQQALKLNRLRVVQRVLYKQGYQIDASVDLHQEHASDCHSLEQQLINQGDAQPASLWRRWWRWLFG